MLRGRVYGYIPDYFIRLEKGNMLILEVKGNEPDEEKAKRLFLQEWVETVNNIGGYGICHIDGVYFIPETPGIIEKYCGKNINITF